MNAHSNFWIWEGRTVTNYRLTENTVELTKCATQL